MTESTDCLPLVHPAGPIQSACRWSTFSLRREGSILYIADIDMLDSTRLLDIKPYIPAFDSHPVSRAGWVDTCRVDRRRADDRFHGSENKGVKDATK